MYDGSGTDVTHIWLAMGSRRTQLHKQQS